MKRLVPIFLRIVCSAVLLLIIIALALVWYQTWNKYQISVRGKVSSINAPLAPLHTPRYGVNVALEQYKDEQALRQALEKARDAGLSVVRQELPWAEIEPNPGQFDWERWDTIVRICSEYHLRVIVVLDTSPAWARSEWESANRWAPPANYSDFAQFAATVAARYGAIIEAYQIWDEPNISPHWGNGEIDPQGYVELLKLASGAIRSADPQALIIAGGMAPTNEQSGKNLSDIQFLREISRRGAGEYYDILGIRALGFWSGPDDRQVSQDTLNFSRAILLREELVRRGQGDKPIWALDAGWCALPTAWQGALSPSGNDTEALQAERLAQALNRIDHEWPWLGLVCLQQLQPNADSSDPIWGYSLLTVNGQPRIFYDIIKAYNDQPAVLKSGITTNLAPFVTSEAEGVSTLYFYGTDIAIDLGGLAAGSSLTLQVDDGKVISPSIKNDTKATWLTIASHLDPQQHTLRITSPQLQAGTIRAIRVSQRVDSLPIIWQSAAAAIGIIYLLIILVKTIRPLPLKTCWFNILRRAQAIPTWLYTGVLTGIFMLAILAPLQMVRWLALAAYGILSLLAPRKALWIAVFCVPLAPLQVRFGPGSFSVAEISLLITVVAFGWQALFSEAPLSKQRIITFFHSLRLLDVAIVVLFIAALVSTSLAEYQRVAWREFRVVIVDSILFYTLIRMQTWDARGLKQIQYILVLSGLCVAVYALIAYATPAGVVETEGVRRARAYFGSPNNLALYLERVLPAALVMGFAARKPRRWPILAGAGLIFVAILLTYSRGALLLGLPAVALTLLGLSKSRWRKLAPILVIVALLALLPVVGTERFTSLLDPTRGTTFIRLGLWRASWLMVRDHPLFGVGPDNFLYYYQDYIQPGAEVERYLSHPHNIVLDFWLRLGIGGLAALVLLAWGIPRCARRIKALPIEPAIQKLFVGCLAGLAAAVVHGLIDSSFFVIELAYWFMITLAWLSAASTGGTRAASLTEEGSLPILEHTEGD